MDSLFPPSPRRFWFKLWICGTACPIALLSYGIYSLITNHSYAIGRTPRIRGFCFVEVTGFQAALMAAAYMGLALALFSNLHAPYSAKLANYSEYGVVLGLAAACVGICWCSWLMLIGP